MARIESVDVCRFTVRNSCLCFRFLKNCLLFTGFLYHFFFPFWDDFFSFSGKTITPKAASEVKLISSGKILENNKTVGQCKLPFGEFTGGVTIMHVVVQPSLAKAKTGDFFWDFCHKYNFIGHWLFLFKFYFYMRFFLLFSNPRGFFKYSGFSTSLYNCGLRRWIRMLNWYIHQIIVVGLLACTCQYSSNANS